MATREVSDEQLEVLVEQELAKRQKVVDEVLAALQPQLEGIRREAASANHIKRTLGRQLSGMETLLKQTMAEVRAHSVLPFHPEGADTIERLTSEAQKGLELLEQFGIAGLSLEEKKALPAVLQEAVQTRKDRQAGDRRERRRTVLLQLAATVIGTTAGTAIAITAILSYVAAHTP